MDQIVIIGAGAFGAWTALCLVEAGARVTLIDMAKPGHDRSSSGGESRNIRATYGDNHFYTAWARDAWFRWREREQQFATQLVFPSGSLRAGTDAELNDQATLFSKIAAPFEILSLEEVRARWPQITPASQDHFYEPDSGILAAAGTLHEIERAFRARGGQMVRAHVSLTNVGQAITVEADGQKIAADTIVLACGPWLPRLLPELLGTFIRTPRRELLFVVPEPGDNRFGWASCPNLTDDLGWTSSDIGNGLKIAPPMKGMDMDLDGSSRLTTPHIVERARAYLAARLPALAERPFVSAYVSQLDNTASEDFIIDRHPDAPHVIIAGGGSGHAFKFGPLIGEYVAQMIFDGSRGSHENRFGLQAHRALAEGEGG